MQNTHQIFFFSFGGPNLRGGGGSTWLGQKTKFFDRFNLKAPLIKRAFTESDTHLKDYHHDHNDSVQAMLGPAGEMNAIPGEAGVDYPVYNTGRIMNHGSVYHDKRPS